MDNTRLLKHASTTNLEEEETVDAPRNNGNVSMPEPNPWRKMMMMTVVIQTLLKNTCHKIWLCLLT